MKTNTFTIISAIAGVTGAAFGAYSMYEMRKFKKERDDLIKTLSDKIDVSVTEIQNAADIDISEKLIKAALDKTAKTVVTNYAEAIRKDITSDMHSECWKAVVDLKDSMHDDVKKTLESKAKKVTIDDIKREVVDKCTEESKRYIRQEMDEITSQYKKQIDNLSQVYHNISTAIGKESSNG